MVAGVIYDPLRDEMFVAERGKGAWLNGRQIHVSKTKALQEALTATGFPSHKRHVSPNIHFYQEFTLRSHGVRRAGSAALDMAYVACGRLDGFWEFHLNPWDTRRGICWSKRRAGRVTHFDGSKFTLDSREVLATNGLIAGEMEHLFGEMFAGRGLEPIPTPAEFAARRAAAGAVMKPRRTARVMVFDPAGRVLLIRCAVQRAEWRVRLLADAGRGDRGRRDTG